MKVSVADKRGSIYCVLDIETAMSDTAASIAAGGERPAISRVALHELVGASILTFGRQDDGRFDGFRQTSFGGVGEDEPTMLRAIDATLRPVHDAGGHLVTFNGSHDVSVLRRRAGRHWLFELLSFEGWPVEPAGRHLDMMRLDVLAASGRWPNLVDASAGFGINAVCPRISKTSRTLSPAVRKAEVDVLATALLLFQHLAMEEGRLDPLAQGWSAMSRWLIKTRNLEDHVRQFSRHPFAQLAREIVDGSGGAGQCGAAAIGEHG